MTNISHLLILGSLGSGIEDVYYFTTNRLALCDGLVRTCLGLAKDDMLPKRIRVTASLRPLKIKNTRKLRVNTSEYFYGDVWSYAKRENKVSGPGRGMYRGTHNALCKLLEINDLNPDCETMLNVWVNIAVLEA